MDLTAKISDGLIWIKRHFGPAMARPAAKEITRASVGVALGIMASGAILQLLLIEFPLGYPHHFSLLAPLAASAFLLMAVPNSPLAQPFSALGGNTLAATVGMTIAHFDLPLPFAACLAVGITVFLMMWMRAMHPPSAALALSAVLSGAATRDMGITYPLFPVALDTSLLIAAAIAFNHLTGRVYPFRIPAPAPVAGSTAPPPHLLAAADVDNLLEEMRLSANIGVEDLSRLFDAAIARASAQRFGGLTAADVMTKSPRAVPPDMRLRAVSDLFSKTGFQSLPVVEGDQMVGLLTQVDLIEHSRKATHAPKTMDGLRRIVGRHAPILVRDMMKTAPPVVAPQAPFVSLMDRLGDPHIDALPVVEAGRLVGLITRSNLIATLAREGMIRYAKEASAR